MKMKLKTLEYAKMSVCTDLDAWVKADKALLNTLEWTSPDPRNGSTRPGRVTAKGFVQSQPVQCVLKAEDGIYYLEFEVKFGADFKKFFHVSSRHNHGHGKAIDNHCCSVVLPHGSLYEKRRAISCAQNWGRKPTSALGTNDPSTFLKDAATFLRMQLPFTPVASSATSQQVLSGGP